jgi:hypothetical protein
MWHQDVRPLGIRRFLVRRHPHSVRKTCTLMSFLRVFTISFCAAFILVPLMSSRELPAQSEIRSKTEEPLLVSLCDVSKNPLTYNHRLLRVTAFVTHGFEDFGLADPSCESGPLRSSIWVKYGGTARSDTIYCCPGEGADQTRREVLRIDDIEIPLVTDAQYQSFKKLLDSEPDTTVHATLVGRFFSGHKQSSDGKIVWGGFGHLGCCSLFVVQEVKAFDAHTRSDLDYTSEAGWYEEAKCDIGPMRWVRHISVTSRQDAAIAINEQKLADAGDRSWAFSDPLRVAIDSLHGLYPGGSPEVSVVRQSPSRLVLLWDRPVEPVLVVVTRPYWLSKFARTSQVVWVSSMVKQFSCYEGD